MRVGLLRECEQSAEGVLAILKRLHVEFSAHDPAQSGVRPMGASGND